MISFGRSPTLSFLWGVFNLVVIVAFGPSRSGVFYVVDGRWVSPLAGYFVARGEVSIILSKLNVGDLLKGFEVARLSGSEFVPDDFGSSVYDLVDGEYLSKLMELFVGNHLGVSGVVNPS